MLRKIQQAWAEIGYSVEECERCLEPVFSKLTDERLQLRKKVRILEDSLNKEAGNESLNLPGIQDPESHGGALSPAPPPPPFEAKPFTPTTLRKRLRQLTQEYDEIESSRKVSRVAEADSPVEESSIGPSSSELHQIVKAVEDGNLGTLERLCPPIIDLLGIDADSWPYQGWTIMHHAAARNRHEVLRWIRRRCDEPTFQKLLDTRTKGSNATCVHIAAMYDDRNDALKCLLSYTRDKHKQTVITSVDLQGETPLMKAAQNGAFVNAQTLLSHLAVGSTISAKNVKGETALQIAKKSGNGALIGLLREFESNDVTLRFSVKAEPDERDALRNMISIAAKQFHPRKPNTKPQRPAPRLKVDPHHVADALSGPRSLSPEPSTEPVVIVTPPRSLSPEPTDLMSFSPPPPAQVPQPVAEEGTPVAKTPSKPPSKLTSKSFQRKIHGRKPEDRCPLLELGDQFLAAGIMSFLDNVDLAHLARTCFHLVFPSRKLGWLSPTEYVSREKLRRSWNEIGYRLGVDNAGKRIEVDSSWTMQLRRYQQPIAKMVVLGGTDDLHRKAHASSETCDLPADSDWESADGQMIYSRSYFAAALTGSSLYVMGGRDQSTYLTSIEVLDLKSLEWSQVPSELSFGRGYCAAAVWQESAIIVGGWDGRQSLSTCESLNLETLEWTTLPSMNTARQGCGAVVAGSQLFVVGGWDGWRNLASAEWLDLHTMRWITVSGETVPAAFGNRKGKSLCCGALIFCSCTENMNCARHACAVARYGSQIIVVGGHDGTSSMATAEVFNLETRTWSLIPGRMQHARSGCTATVQGAQLYVVGGFDGSKSLRSIEVLDLDSLEWNPALETSMTTPRRGCHALVTYDIE